MTNYEKYREYETLEYMVKRITYTGFCGDCIALKYCKNNKVGSCTQAMKNFLNLDCNEESPKTYGDYLRSLSNEEMAKHFELTNNCTFCALEGDAEKCYKTSCYDAMLDFINQPYRTDGVN